MKLHKSSVVTIGVLIAVVLVVAVYAFMSFNEHSSSTRQEPDITYLEKSGDSLLKTLDGTPFELSSLKGVPILINSWASWSPFSKDELSQLSELEKEYGSRISLVAINRGEDPARIQSYLSHIGYQGSIHILVNETDTYYKSVGGFAMPETILYDREGNIADHVRGTIHLDVLRTKIEQILAE